MGVERSATDTIKIKKSNSGDLYRPPALRNHGNGAIRRICAEAGEFITNGTSLNTETKERTSSSTPAITSTTTTSISCNNSPIYSNENAIINSIATTSAQQEERQVDEQKKQPQRQQMRRERRPDRAVYIPRARRSQTTPPNTATSQIQPPTQQQQQQQESTQLPLLTPTTSLNQQLAITLDDTTVSVNQKPWPKADDAIGKINSGVVYNNTCSNNSTPAIVTTTAKKKEKLNKENKESREHRREQRLLRKLSTISTQHIQNNKNNDEYNESSINNILSNADDDVEIITNRSSIANPQQIQSSPLTRDVNNISELDDILNFSKGFNCDRSEEFILNPKQETSSSTIIIPESIEKYQINDTLAVNASILSTSESQFLCKPVHSVEIHCKTSTNNTSTENKAATENIIIKDNNIHIMPKPSVKNKSSKSNTEVLNQTKLSNLHIEDVASQQLPKKCDVEEQELQRASKEINRSNRRIIKQTFLSDILQIPDHVNEDDNENKSKIVEDNNDSATKSPRTTTQIDSNTEDEEDDWESMYNDSGDCLDPKIMQELTASVGKCKIELPKMDYSAFLTKQSILNEEEFPHVLEVSNFPVEFRNHDLLMVFSQYKESGFDIKWVDDTHALAVFSSSRIAAEVLTMGHPFVVLKPLTEATIESRLKAKKCAASLQPYRPRPETCAALARRLVTGALGVRLKTAAAERENEKRVLREAKERKLLAAKQRDEVWES